MLILTILLSIGLTVHCFRIFQNRRNSSLNEIYTLVSLCFVHSINIFILCLVLLRDIFKFKLDIVSIKLLTYIMRLYMLASNLHMIYILIQVYLIQYLPRHHQNIVTGRKSIAVALTLLWILCILCPLKITTLPFIAISAANTILFLLIDCWARNSVGQFNQEKSSFSDNEKHSILDDEKHTMIDVV